MSIKSASRILNKPSVTMASVGVAVALGLTKSPHLEYLRPAGSVYLALLQMSVLPFLLSAIPLGIRSAISQKASKSIAWRGAIWILLFTALLGATGVILGVSTYASFPIDAKTTAALGGMVGGAAGEPDIIFAMDASDPGLAATQTAHERSIADVIPSNIFAALSANQITSVLIFAGIFGLGMAMSERQTGNSFFSDLKHLHDVCLLIFEWLNLLVPFAIIALIAPQVARTGPEIFVVLGQFLFMFVAGSVLIILCSILLIALAVRGSVFHTLGSMLKPLSLVAATRNAFACIPLAVDVLTKELRVSRSGCELFIPLGFTLFRFGFILHFAAAAIFMGALVGRNFDVQELVMIGVLSTLASFGTIGLSGPAGLSSLAAVLRPFSLSFELALPILVVVDPIVGMLRAAVTVAVVCAVVALAAGREPDEDTADVAEVDTI